MIIMPEFERSFPIIFNDFEKAGEVSIQIQGILKTIGFAPDLIRRVAICAYESEMNAVMHGGDGTAFLTVDTGKIVLLLEDHGPGIEDIELAFQEGYSTATAEHRDMGFGAGMGLPNIKKNSDSLDVHTERGKGTRVTMEFEVS